MARQRPKSTWLRLIARCPVYCRFARRPNSSPDAIVGRIDSSPSRSVRRSQLIIRSDALRARAQGPGRDRPDRVDRLGFQASAVRSGPTNSSGRAPSARRSAMATCAAGTPTWRSISAD